MNHVGIYRFRHADPNDTFAIMRLHQLARNNHASTELFLDHIKLTEALKASDMFWVVQESNEGLVGVAALAVDVSEGLAKLVHVRILPTIGDRKRAFRDLIQYVTRSIVEDPRGIEVVYTTTRAVNPEEQEATLDLGYAILGVFPSASPQAHRRLNGLTVHYKDEVLEKHRFANFSLHPSIAPLYALARQDANLGDVPLADLSNIPKLPQDEPPSLELVSAPRYVSHQFSLLKRQRFLSTNYYPFQEPNAMLVDPEQLVTVYAKIDPAQRFAAIIGENLKAGIDPVALYRRVCEILFEAKISYVEMVCDASDIQSVHVAMSAGFLPCAYFPCLKRHNAVRRDYIVFAKTYELVGELGSPGHPRYMEYLREYLRLARQREGA